MSFSKKGISATELQRQLGQSLYETIWVMTHKISEAMGKRDSMYGLTGMVKIDEAYFETETSEKEKQNLKLGKGSQRHMTVAVAAESNSLDDLETGKKGKHCRYFIMKVLDGHTSDEVNEFVEHNIAEESIVFSDKSISCINIADFVEVHIREKSTNETTKTTHQWVQIAVSNTKRTLLGMYHKIKSKYLQLYLDKFCHNLNRRYFREKAL